MQDNRDAQHIIQSYLRRNKVLKIINLKLEVCKIFLILEKQPDPMNQTSLKPWQQKLHEIIYEADTPAGKWFDIVLLLFIVASVLFVMLESVKGLPEPWYDF